MGGWFFKKLSITASLALSMLLLAGCLSTPLAGGLQNPAFEQNANGEPQGWFIAEAAKAKGEITVVVDGGNRLRLSPNGQNVGGDDPLGVGQALDAASFHGQSLQVTASLSADGGAAAVVGLVALNAAGAPVETLLLREDTGGGTMVDRQTAASDPLPASARTLILFASAEGTSGRVWFDNIAIVSTGAAAAAAPALASGGPVAPTTVRVNPDQAIANVRSGIFGTNVEWIRNANDLWDARSGRLDPEIMALGQQAGIKGIRFPGGVWSDAYQWTDGVGPQASRPSTPHVPGDQEKSRHVIGTDEIVAVAKSWGAKLILTVNVGNGTPQQAGAWAAYVRDTHGAGIVDFWEIGNELYMKGDLSGGHTDPETYAARVLEFAQAIRAEIPSAKISAIGLVNRGRYNFNAHNDWNEVVLSWTAQVIDYYAVHNAYAPIVVAERMRDGPQVYRAMFAAPQLVAENLATTRSIMQANGAGNASIAVTEWGPMFSIDPKNPYFDHVKTLGSAVFVARTLNVFLRDPKVSSAQFFKLSDLLNSGWIGRDGRGGHKAVPSLQAFQLYAEGARGQVLGVQLDGPTYRSPSTGYVGTVSQAPVVDALATRDGNAVTVFLSSAELASSAPVTLSLAGRDGATFQMETTLLSGRAPDAHNGTEMISVPGLAFAAPEGFSGTGAFERPQSGDVRVTKETTQVTLPLQIDLPPHSVMRLRLTPR